MAEKILAFYHSFIGTEGCTWSEEYPGPEHICMDIEHGNLFLLKDEKGIARKMLLWLMDELKNRGTVSLYDHEWYCYEKKI